MSITMHQSSSVPGAKSLTETHNYQHNCSRAGLHEEEEEEFCLHLQFDNGSYPLRHNVNDIHFLGIVNGNLFIRIGDSYFIGQHDKRSNSSVLFTYDKHHQAVYETNKCHSRILMKRVLLKSKESQEDHSDSWVVVENQYLARLIVFICGMYVDGITVATDCHLPYTLCCRIVAWPLFCGMVTPHTISNLLMSALLLPTRSFLVSLFNSRISLVI